MDKNLWIMDKSKNKRVMYGVSASLFILYGTVGFLSLSIRRLQEEYLYSFDHAESRTSLTQIFR
jgi:hypothetical protein